MTVSHKCPSVEGYEASHRPQDLEFAHMCRASYNTSFACTLGYPERNNTLCTFCQCILYNVHCIVTVLLNDAIVHEMELM